MEIAKSQEAKMLQKRLLVNKTFILDYFETQLKIAVMSIASHTIVAGAGITGLTLAAKLKEAGAGVKVFYDGDRPGGAIKTVNHKGWILETGPNTIVQANTYIRSLIGELGLSDSVMEAAPVSSNRYIVRDKKLRPLPSGPAAFLGSKLFSSRAKLRLFREPFIRPGDDPNESLGRFVERRLGREFLDYAINPFVAGVYAGDPAALSVRHAFPMLYKLEHKYGSLIKGQFRIKPEDRKPGDIPRSKAPLITFRYGNSELTDALAQKLNGDLTSGFELKSVAKKEGDSGIFYELKNSSGEKAECRRLILTLPLHVLRKIRWEGFGPDSPAHIPDVYHPPLTVVHLGYHKTQIESPLDGFGMLVPEAEKLQILGCLFNSSLFEARTPNAEFELLTCFVGGSRNPGLAESDDETIYRAVENDLSLLLGISSKPKLRYLTRWKKAIPQYGLDYDTVYEKLNSIENAHQGLFFAGNFRNGISVPDCVRNAVLLSEKLTAEATES